MPDRVRQTKIPRPPPKQERKTQKRSGLNIAAPISEVGHNVPQERHRRTLFTSFLQRVQISLAKPTPRAALRVTEKICRRVNPGARENQASSGRLVEYEGGGEETRSNKWLAELQQTMF